MSAPVDHALVDMNQIRSACNACEARMENGAEQAQAFTWLYDELERIVNGEVIYE